MLYIVIIIMATDALDFEELLESTAVDCQLRRADANPARLSFSQPTAIDI